MERSAHKLPVRTYPCPASQGRGTSLIFLGTVTFFLMQEYRLPADYLLKMTYSDIHDTEMIQDYPERCGA